MNFDAYNKKNQNGKEHVWRGMRGHSCGDSTSLETCMRMLTYGRTRIKQKSYNSRAIVSELILRWRIHLLTCIFVARRMNFFTCRKIHLPRFERGYMHAGWVCVLAFSLGVIFVSFARSPRLSFSVAPISLPPSLRH